VRAETRNRNRAGVGRDNGLGRKLLMIIGALERDCGNQNAEGSRAGVDGDVSGDAHQGSDLVEFIRTRGIRKEDRAQELLAKRGDHPGLVCILSAMEPCSTYKPWHNKQSGKTYLVPNDGKCLHLLLFRG